MFWKLKNIIFRLNSVKKTFSFAPPYLRMNSIVLFSVSCFYSVRKQNVVTENMEKKNRRKIKTFATNIFFIISNWMLP